MMGRRHEREIKKSKSVTKKERVKKGGREEDSERKDRQHDEKMWKTFKEKRQIVSSRPAEFSCADL